MRKWKVSKQFMAVLASIMVVIFIIDVVLVTVWIAMLGSNEVPFLIKAIMLLLCAAPFFLIWLLLTIPIRIVETAESRRKQK
jgi:hypothetical protein